MCFFVAPRHLSILPWLWLLQSQTVSVIILKKCIVGNGWSSMDFLHAKNSPSQCGMPSYGSPCYVLYSWFNSENAMLYVNKGVLFLYSWVVHYWWWYISHVSATTGKKSVCTSPGRRWWTGDHQLWAWRRPAASLSWGEGELTRLISNIHLWKIHVQIDTALNDAVFYPWWLGLTLKPKSATHIV